MQMIPVIIILIVIGCILIIGSYLFQQHNPIAGKTEENKSVEKLLQNHFKEAKDRLDDVAEETAGIVKNQTERELEKLSNEKIQAVSEYSDQVMDEINKNHQEVMFLYSMLNDKQEELKSTVEKLNQVKTLKENEVKLSKARMGTNNSIDDKVKTKITKEEIQEQLISHATADTDASFQKNIPNEKSAHKNKSNISANKDRNIDNLTNKEKILLMHQEGVTNLEIARQLNLGIGEVRLVIDLYRASGSQEEQENE